MLKYFSLPQLPHDVLPSVHNHFINPFLTIKVFILPHIHPKAYSLHATSLCLNVLNISVNVSSPQDDNSVKKMVKQFSLPHLPHLVADPFHKFTLVMESSWWSEISVTSHCSCPQFLIHFHPNCLFSERVWLRSFFFFVRNCKKTRLLSF